MSTPRDRLAHLASTYGATISTRRYVSSSIHVNKSSVRLAAPVRSGVRDLGANLDLTKQYTTEEQTWLALDSFVQYALLNNAALTLSDLLTAQRASDPQADNDLVQHTVTTLERWQRDGLPIADVLVGIRGEQRVPDIVAFIVTRLNSGELRLNTENATSSINNMVIPSLNYMLFAASEFNYRSLVRYLIEKTRTNVHAYNDEALRVAAESGHIGVVRYLVEHGGADVHARDDEALRHAAKNGHLDVVRYLIEHNTGVHARDDEALRGAAENGHIDVVRYLVEHGANVRADDDEALRYAALYGHADVVQYLVEHEADVNAYDDEALRDAADAGYLDVVRYLVEHGANVNAVDLNIVNDDIRTYINGLQPNVKRARNRGQLALMSRLRI